MSAVCPEGQVCWSSGEAEPDGASTDVDRAVVEFDTSWGESQVYVLKFQELSVLE